MIPVEIAVAIIDMKKSIAIRVRGTSMFPEIFSGDEVTIAPYDATMEINIDDIVLIETVEKRVLLHRVVGWQDHLPKTKGDALIDEDEACHRVLGKCIKVEKFLKSRLARIYYQMMKKIAR